jgi:hypothetical protein
MMRYLMMMGVLALSLTGCALEKPQGVPHSVWAQLTPEQQQTLINYNQKKAAEKNRWIWKSSAEQPVHRDLPRS